MNVEKMTNYRLNKKARSLYNKLSCYLCESEEGICVKCANCQTTSAHPMCLWLAGDHIELTEQLNKSEQRLAKSIKIDLVQNINVREMFHSIGPGSNGGYHKDPALKIKFKTKRDIEYSKSISLLENDEMSDCDETKVDD